MINELYRPIFIVGTGRCGSTILNKMLAEHPHLAFLTTASNVFPSHPGIQRLVLRTWDKPILGPLLRLRLIAGEGWNLWDRYVPGFSRCYRDFRAGDITQNQKLKLRRELPRLLTKKRNRLLIKFTGWTRIGFIKEVFPDARIIHITRDPRAVINSMLQVDFWTGRHGPYHLNWGGLTEEESDIWNRFNQSFVALAVIEYKKILTAYHDSIERMPKNEINDILNLSYSNICKDHINEMNKVLTFCDLEQHPSFVKKLSSYNLKNQNDKWKSNLTLKQQQVLEAIITELDLNKFDDY
ncbi:MAG: sulfotransferase [Gammaproteobacteria bacterium]|nr:sulfotransferase [Gammaproteobacteria bacterium]